MAKFFLYVIAAVCVLLISCACQGEQKQLEPVGDTPDSAASAGAGDVDVAQPVASPKKISAEDVQKMMSETQNFILVDVRTEEEYREAHIEGAILIPDNEIEVRAEAELPDKNAVIIVYCRSGVRSAGAADILANLGYTQVLDLGGIIDWPFETVAGTE